VSGLAPPPLRALALAAALAALPLPGSAARGDEGAGPPRPGPAAAWAAEDDFVRAFAAAKAQGALVLVDVWAPW
jgi:hypothetical protein